jgi:hypothetical protein
MGRPAAVPTAEWSFGNVYAGDRGFGYRTIPASR